MASNRKSQNRLTTNPGESESDEKRHAHGAIARIKLENFMTYKEVELFPGPRLNVIIGPNGSGKSSIVCAICLGLAGSTKIIGRAHNVCEYIKTGCEKAIIEIELFNQEDGCNWIINRTINTNNSSIWTLNGKKSTEGDIKNQVRKLHIQVDNLCQFLPQEKVADFTRMSKDDMLENTEKCVGGETLFQLHKSLKDLGEKARNYEQELNELESEISTSKQAIKHMEPDMQSFQGRKELETKIMHYTQYKGYLEYEEKALEHQRVAQAWEEMKKRINEVKQRLKPVTDIMNDRKKDMEKSQTLFRTKLKQTLELKTRLTNAINAFTEDKDDLIEKIREDLRHKREEERRRIEQCEDITNQISVLTEQLEITDQNANDHNDLEVEWNELEKNRKQLDQQNHSLQVKGQRITDDLRKLQLQLTSKQRELEQINNVQNIRLQKLQSFNPDAFKAVQWYRKNKHLFKKVVYEPMILSLNIEDQNMTKYVEFIIPKRDLTAMFIFEDTDDMELFISECHTKQHLVVHASAIPRMTLQAYKNEAKPISTYQYVKLHYGMRKYVLDVIDGPDPVLRYLCQTTKIHMIPIADDSALKTIDTLINDQTLNIRRFFYTISTSFYSRQTSTTNVQVQNARFLTDSINQQRKQQLENDYQNLKQDHAKLTTDYRASQDEILELAKELDGIKQQKVCSVLQSSEASSASTICIELDKKENT
ncbi:unnamed protein product [Didymodactylos carnosus]|uniref:Structural maintenance of chromosomes protein 5 n=1 Tax=Didymodactylos carnosus TaxID=1234261 RepID=A0A813WM16_9BILA|nr:unnamed protein product [Didymodactylos carnosus]CAF0853148.1 unnamed protein product [Didymodactylos carnosus]CAF3614082.1 unnamed protein product [Didymodactylos carnosus]CAF3640845.1 unnamed protein product [Didymodactylos carnosus]